MNSSAPNFTITTASSVDPRFITTALLLRLGLKESQLLRPKADGPSLGKIVTSFSIYLPSIQQHVTMRISGFGGRGHLTPLLPPYEGSLSFRRPIWLELPSDSALALSNRVSLLGSYREFLWTPLPSPTFSLLTGQWLDFHQLADYHASRTTTLNRVRGGNCPRLPTEPCVRVRTRLLT